MPVDKSEILNFMNEHRKSEDNPTKAKSFVEYLYFLMDKYNIDKSSDLYNKANISKQLWSSIISEKSNPSINVCIKIVFALHASNKECKYLLKKAGYTLPSSSKYALIIRYYIEHQIFDLSELNDSLIEFGFTDSLIK